VARGIVIRRRRFPEHGQERRIHDVSPAVAPCRGESVEGSTAIRAGKAESRTDEGAREVGALWTGRPRLDENVFCEGVCHAPQPGLVNRRRPKYRALLRLRLGLGQMHDGRRYWQL
jgi:hypothetical protein